MRNDEEQHQAALWQWEKTQWHWPFFVHIPNERINKREAIRLSRLGVRRGVPDNFWFIPRGNFVGLVIELKRPGVPHMDVRPGQVSPDQVTFAKMLSGMGWYVGLCYGWQDATVVVADYLNSLHRRDPIPVQLGRGVARALAFEFTDNETKLLAAKKRRKRR